MSSSYMPTAGNVPLKLFEPMNIVIFLSFFSPLIVATILTSMSFFYQNFKGLIYLGFLIGCCFVRSFVYSSSGALPMANDGTICTSIQFDKYGNPTFSAFVFDFTLMYLSIPMFTNGSPNFWVFFSLLVYFIADLFIKIYKKCIVKMSDLFLNVLLGATSAAIIVSWMYVGGSGKYLFYNEVSSSNTDVCYQPSQQTFKCSLYKNGELISEMD